MKLQFPGGEIDMPTHADPVPGVRAEFEERQRAANVLFFYSFEPAAGGQRWSGSCWGRDGGADAAIDDVVRRFPNVRGSVRVEAWIGSHQKTVLEARV